MRMFRRICKEIEYIIDDTDYINLDIDNSDKLNFKYILKINNKKIIFTGEYPFIPPKMFINDIPYNKFLVTPSDKIRLLLSKHKYGCLCCKNIFCNWGPMKNVKNILDEISEYNCIKTNIKYHLLVSEIILKFGKDIPDFLITEYLI